MKYVYFLAFYFTSYFASTLQQRVRAPTDTILLQEFLQVHDTISTDTARISPAIQALAESFINAVVNLVNTAGSGFHNVPGFQELLNTLAYLTKIIPN
ncbi:hypothetical protein NQ176_g2818 [Zarea fungicola]|uniref:Uncharacterized protein n=1 Tax=Zarea fungicola TaxID=93591 RepID=A0ACC1NM42_9HYPO|nr:hypothetical protein NQ176_g2818 [Lecanicillium fungicola]